MEVIDLNNLDNDASDSIKLNIDNDKRLHHNSYTMDQID